MSTYGSALVLVQYIPAHGGASSSIMLYPNCPLALWQATYAYVAILDLNVRILGVLDLNVVRLLAIGC